MVLQLYRISLIIFYSENAKIPFVKWYGATKIVRMFTNKNWTFSGVKTVLSKIDATGSIEYCSGSGWPRTARNPDTISDMAAEQSDLNPIDYVVRGDPTRVCVKPPPDHGRGRAMPARRGGMGRLDQEVIDNAISEWRKQLTACVAAGRGHFEHSL